MSSRTHRRIPIVFQNQSQICHSFQNQAQNISVYSLSSVSRLLLEPTLTLESRLNFKAFLSSITNKCRALGSRDNVIQKQGFLQNSFLIQLGPSCVFINPRFKGFISNQLLELYMSCRIIIFLESNLEPQKDSGTKPGSRLFQKVSLLNPQCIYMA